MASQEYRLAIEELVEASLQREFEHSLVNAIYEASPDGILVVDENAMIVSHNRQLFEVFGITPTQILEDSKDNLIGQPDQLLLSKALELVNDQKSFLQRVQELYDNPEIVDVCEIELKDSRVLARHSRALWSATHRYLGRVWFFRDVSKQKQIERSLRELSYRDPLTGAANRRYFFKRAFEEISRIRRFGGELSFILLDIDNFKKINDRWGHDTGDRVLEHFCKCTSKVLRQADLLGRLGGEEFAVLLPDTGLQGAYVLAERLRTYVAEQPVTEGYSFFNYTFSAGVSGLQPEDSSAKVALTRADRALLVAKSAGRNCVRLEVI